MLKEFAIIVFAGMLIIDLVIYIKDGGLKFIDAGKN